MNHNHQRHTTTASKPLPKETFRRKVKRGTPSVFAAQNAKQLNRKPTQLQKQIAKKFHTRKSRRFLKRETSRQANDRQWMELTVKG
jgi:hypothetical protein